MSKVDTTKQINNNIESSEFNNSILKKTQPVKIINFDMPFISMVKFMIKWAIASVPALIILFIILIMLTFFIISIFGTIMFTSFNQV